MRIYWPTTVKLPPEGGVAIGWKRGQQGEVLRVAAVVPAWRDEFSLMSSDITVLAKAKGVASLSPEGNYEHGSDLTIYLENNIPVALSEPPLGRACVVLYTPASSVADLLIHKSEEADTGGQLPYDDVMDAFVQSTNVQRFIFENTIPRRRSWAWLADIPRNLFLFVHAAPMVFRPSPRDSSMADRRATFSHTGQWRMPRLTWRTSEEFKAATRMPLPRVRRHGFASAPGISSAEGDGDRPDLTFRQVLPVIFVVLFIFRRYWLPLVWQAVLALMVIVAWLIYEVGLGVFKGILLLSDRFNFVNAVRLRLWNLLADARYWSAAVDAVCFTWALASGLGQIREDSLRYKQNLLRLRVDSAIGPIIGALLLRLRPLRISPSAILVDPVIAAIDWLNSWPVGFKLNTELSNFMSSTLKAALNVWKDGVIPHIPVLYIFVFLVIGCTAGPLGSFSHALDAFRLITLHLRVGYLFTGALYRWQMSALGGLWNLFRGKRWNTLRRRTDSHAYDLDTLFLGTLLFTLSVFLAPTLIAYYGLFALINATLVVVEGLLMTGIVWAKTCPWYELQLRTRFPDALPGRVVFEPVSLPVLQATGVYPVEQMLKARVTPKSYGEVLAPMREHLSEVLVSLKSHL